MPDARNFLCIVCPYVPSFPRHVSRNSINNKIRNYKYSWYYRQ
jgi:hypothetical protein